MKNSITVTDLGGFACYVDPKDVCGIRVAYWADEPYPTLVERDAANDIYVRESPYDVLVKVVAALEVADAEDLSLRMASIEDDVKIINQVLTGLRDAAKAHAEGSA